MKKGKVDLEKYLYAKEYLKDDTSNELMGSEAICFIEGKKVIKIYLEPKEEQNIDLSKYQSERIAFPKYYLEKDNLRYGEVLPYFRGKTLEKGLSWYTNVDSFIYNYEDIIYEITLYPNIKMNEISYFENVIYLPINGFYLIDTTKWQETKENMTLGNIYGINRVIISHLSKVIFEKEVVLANRDLDKYYQCLEDNSLGQELKELLKCNFKEDYHIISLLKAYKEFIKAYYGYEVENIGDIKKYTKMMKNS